MVFRLINEDGTDMLDYPKNPLLEKWSKLYPPVSIPEYSEVCDGYSCDGCSRCPYGTEWIVPEEDLEIWNEYQNEVLEYNKIHNPNLYKLNIEGKKKIKTKK